MTHPALSSIAASAFAVKTVGSSRVTKAAEGSRTPRPVGFSIAQDGAKRRGVRRCMPFILYASHAVRFFCLKIFLSPFPLFLRCFVVQSSIFMRLSSPRLLAPPARINIHDSVIFLILRSLRFLLFQLVKIR